MSVRIALDAMGGDYAPAEVVAGAFLAARALPDVEIFLFGPPSILPEGESPPPNVQLVPSHEWIGMDESPVKAVRQKPEATINRVCRFVRDGHADVAVTMGHTGAAFIAARFAFGMLPGIERPAVPVPYFRLHPHMVIIDVGANTDVRPRHLLQFARMGSAYAQAMFGVEHPRVGLLTVGTEPRKGSLVIQAAYDLLEASELNFVGSIEGLDVAHGRVDVVVHDGYVGNVVLKLTEGLVDELLSRALERVLPVAGHQAEAVRSALLALREENSYARIGAAPLLGVNGLIYIGHGRSRARAVAAGLKQAYQGVRHGLLERLIDM
ncbi:MAG: phosphate acyltransferase PlsX [Chloroflexi bacterium]|nr:phosphate acyltransferase PlsX [Chloroflexota bacterium]